MPKTRGEALSSANVGKLALLAVASALIGCARDAPEVKACEDELLMELRSPSTYKRVEANSYPDRYAPETPTLFNVFIRFDAANAFGTPIRSVHQCTFAVKDGRADPAKRLANDPGSSDEELRKLLAETARDIEDK